MSSFQLSLKSVFGGGLTADYSNHLPPARPWPIFSLVPSPRAPEPPEELAEIFDAEILPRLIVAHGTSTTPNMPPIAQAESAARALSGDMKETFVRIVLSRAPELVGAFIRPLLIHGFSVDEIYSKLLEPTARMLIDLWSEDIVSYMEVTIGLGRLQQIVHNLETSTRYNGDNDPAAPSAMFVPKPGEQQTFGFYIMEELFRWSGWRTWVETSATVAQINATVACQWFDMLCLSVTREPDINQMSTTIEELRHVSRNDHLFVMVNGRPFAEHPDLIEAVGADAAATNGGEALTIMETALGRCH